jgi:hypothetical protein
MLGVPGENITLLFRNVNMLGLCWDMIWDVFLITFCNFYMFGLGIWIGNVGRV